MTALTTAITSVLGFATSTLSTIMGDPVLALSIGFPVAAGAIGILRRII